MTKKEKIYQLFLDNPDKRFQYDSPEVLEIIEENSRSLSRPTDRATSILCNLFKEKKIVRRQIKKNTDLDFGASSFRQRSIKIYSYRLNPKTH